MQKRKISFISVSSFILLTICSMTSFLFPIHNRVDQNCFMTIGKGIIYGQVPYRDLFDHKGPIIYFMHAAAALISTNSFIGIFLIQYISLVILMIYIKKIVCLFCSEQYSYLLALLTTAIILTTNCYLRGDNAEEYVISIMTVSIYYTLRHHMHNRTSALPNSIFFINGLFIGFVLWLKFNLLGFWIGWALFAFIPILKSKQYKTFLISLLFTMGGVFLITLPWLIYFAYNNALYNLFYTYFYCNIFLYTKKAKYVTIFYLLFESFIKNFALNPVYIFITTIGIYYFFFTKKFIKNKICQLNLLISFIFMYLGVYFSGVWYDYYALIIAGYTIFGTIALFNLLYLKVFKRLSLACTGRFTLFATIIILLFSLLYSNCLPYLNKDKFGYPQYKFAKIINKHNNVSLLNYGFIDGGFYLASHIQPQNKYFHKVNISKENLPEMYEEQLNIIKSKQVDFVVVRVALYNNGINIKSPELFDNYKVVSCANDIFDPYIYFLFEKT